MKSVEVVEDDILMERLVIEQFPGWSGGKARLDIGAIAGSAMRLAGPPEGTDDVAVELGGLCC